MSDVAIISICVTVLVALLIIHLMIKGGKGFVFKGKTKIGDFEIGQEAHKTATESKSAEVPLKNDKKDDNFETCVELLIEYRGFMEAISNASLGILRLLLDYAQRNHVNYENVEAFNLYIVERGLDVVAEIDKSFINSSSVFIRSLTCEKLLGDGYAVFTRMWQKGYKDFYRKLSIDIKTVDNSDEYIKFIAEFITKFGEVWVYTRTMLVDAFVEYLKKNKAGELNK